MGSQLLATIKVIQGQGDDLDADDSDQDGQAVWLKNLRTTCEKMVEALPTQLELLNRTAQAIQNPLFRFMEREVTGASNLLDTVKRDLLLLIEMCVGTRKSTNILKKLAEDLTMDVIPQKWRRYTVANIPASAWLSDFVKRVTQL